RFLVSNQDIIEYVRNPPHARGIPHFLASRDWTPNSHDNGQAHHPGWHLVNPPHCRTANLNPR
ncbi:hypothetical protein, partial [Mobiluncus mulieris]|uniref:hypothetical protein n=1 Tax=Mobiluncus mulieris TaxID=2052 RepID=UPI001B8B7FA9